jgi:hypothetical protein
MQIHLPTSEVLKLLNAQAIPSFTTIEVSIMMSQILAVNRFTFSNVDTRQPLLNLIFRIKEFKTYNFFNK